MSLLETYRSFMRAELNARGWRPTRQTTEAVVTELTNTRREQRDTLTPRMQQLWDIVMGGKPIDTSAIEV